MLKQESRPRVGFFAWPGLAVFGPCLAARGRSGLHGEQVRIAREDPSPVQFLAQDRERVAFPVHRQQR